MSNATIDREAFLERRRSAIGASDVAAILGLSRWATPWEVWAEKKGLLESDSGNAATSAGNLLEPAVLDYAESQLGELDRDVLVRSQALPLAATCDAIKRYGGNPVEAKTTGIAGPVYGSWGDPLTDQVPEEYLVQVHAQLICTGADLGYLFALIPGRGFVEFHIEPNKKLHAHLIDKLGDWWQRHIIDGIEPSHERLPDLEVVKRLRREPGKAIEGTARLQELIDLREEAKESEREARNAVKGLETQILLELGDAETASLPGGDVLSYLEVSRRGYTVEPCSYRQLRVKKGKAK